MENSCEILWKIRRAAGKPRRRHKNARERRFSAQRCPKMAKNWGSVNSEDAGPQKYRAVAPENGSQPEFRGSGWRNSRNIRAGGRGNDGKLGISRKWYGKNTAISEQGSRKWALGSCFLKSMAKKRGKAEEFRVLHAPRIAKQGGAKGAQRDPRRP